MTVKDAIYKNTFVLRPNFKRANWEQIRDDVDTLTFRPGAEVEDMTDDLLAMINETKKSPIVGQGRLNIVCRG